MVRRTITTTVIVAVCAALLQATPAAAAPEPVANRNVEPVVLTGASLPGWSRLPAEGVAEPHFTQAGVRDAHHGRLFVPEDSPGAPVDQVAAYSFDGESWREVPVQVDERFPYFLANDRSDFSIYSGTDKELTYEWDVESWKKTAGECQARYPDEDNTLMKGFPTEDPVRTLDHDDEVVVMASDAGAKAPAGALGPPGTTHQRYEIALADPLTGSTSFVYLFLQPQGSSFDSANGYVSYERDANADEWIDRNSFSKDDPEILGTSNTGYGPNLEGTVCDPDGTIRRSTDRFPRDGLTVTTDSYRWRATGRWMVREMRVANPDAPDGYGPDLVDRWKGRAFQQSPDSEISVVGFEDEQVNWEANSSLLGERMGPVRAIRETWGADSGTNVTKTEYFYRDAVVYRYRVRVHPIPPDGLYTSWDYNHDAVGRYYNELNTTLATEGVPIDGRPDELVQGIDGVEHGGAPSPPEEAPDEFEEGWEEGSGQIEGELDPDGDGKLDAYFDAPDPTFGKPLAMLNWEQVSGNGDNGSLVYMFEMKNAQAFENPTVVPYYQDDACFDDGTGDDPSPRPYPGERYSDLPAAERDRPCFTEAPAGYSGPYRQGAFGAHGIHYFFTGDTDNSFSPERTTEIDGQQWQWAVQTETPHPVGERYANTVKTPLVPITRLQGSIPDRYRTRLTIDGDLGGQTTDRVTLGATLSSSEGPVSGRQVFFSLGGDQVGSDVTDDEGRATLALELGGPARTTQLEASFAGDAEYHPARASSPFEISHEDTVLGLTLRRTPNRVFADARLTEADGAPLGSRTVTFTHRGFTKSATTDAYGQASVSFRSPRQARRTVVASFGGDESFSSATASAQ